MWFLTLFFSYISTRYTSLPQGKGGRPVYPVKIIIVEKNCKITLFICVEYVFTMKKSFLWWMPVIGCIIIYINAGDVHCWSTNSARQWRSCNSSRYIEGLNCTVGSYSVHVTELHWWVGHLLVGLWNKFVLQTHAFWIRIVHLLVYSAPSMQTGLALPRNI